MIWYRGLRRLPQRAKKRDLGSEADWAMVKLTRVIVLLTVITVLSSAAAVFMSWRQVDVAEKAVVQAEADGDEEKMRTRAALKAASDQAKSTQDAVAVAVRALNLQSQQNTIAKSALLLDQTPHITVAANGLGTTRPDEQLTSIIKISNTGLNTLYNAVTYTKMVLSAEPSYPSSWMELPWRGKDTLGPGDTATYHVYHPPLQPEQFYQLRARKLFVIVASRTFFKDAAGRKHARYVCQFHGVLNNTFTPDECPTPPQY